MANFDNQSHIAKLKPRLAILQKIAPELIVSDPSRIAIVRLESKWASNMRWDIYVPSSNYQLCLATRAISDHGYPESNQCIPLPTGRYELEIEELKQADGYRIQVTAGEDTLLDVVESSTFRSNGSASSSRGAQGIQFDGFDEFELLRKRFMVNVPGSPSGSRSSNGPVDGILLWIKDPSR